MRWQDRFVHDELWLRSRRLVHESLVRAGLDSSLDRYRSYMAIQHRRGCVLLDALSNEIPVQRAAELGGVGFLGSAGRAFALRLPFLLAFTDELAAWLALLTAADSGRVERVRRLSALFNLGIVLVDQVTDDPERCGDLGQVVDAACLERLAASPVAADEMTAAAAGMPTPETRVLASLVAAFFRGVHELTAPSEPSLLARLMTALATAYRGQLDSRDPRCAEAGRAKSVVPFRIPPLLVAIAAEGRTGTDAVRLEALGEKAGEVFWRVDDLVDVTHDYHAGHANLVLLRAGLAEGRNGDGLIGLLAGDGLEALGDEIEVRLRDFRGALAGAVTTTAGARALAWLEMYVLDWIR